MTLNEYIECLQEFALTGNNGKPAGDLPVCVEVEGADTFHNELEEPPVIVDGDYADDTSTRWSYKRGPHVLIAWNYTA